MMKTSKITIERVDDDRGNWMLSAYYPITSVHPYKKTETAQVFYLKSADEVLRLLKIDFNLDLFEVERDKYHFSGKQAIAWLQHRIQFIEAWGWLDDVVNILIDILLIAVYTALMIFVLCMVLKATFTIVTGG